MADRVEPFSSVRLVLVVKKDNTFVEPTRMVKLLKSADVDVLSVLLKEVIGVPLVCQGNVYIDLFSNLCICIVFKYCTLLGRQFV